MTILCVIDTETTGLDPLAGHQPYEVCWWKENEPEPRLLRLGHTLDNADEYALSVGHYHERGFHPFPPEPEALAMLAKELEGVTLVGSNPAFDAAHLRQAIGHAPWHHRLINVAEGGMWVFGWNRPKGLIDVVAACRHLGYEIPEPDHTAEGDVRATVAVYYALRDIRG